MQKHLFLIAIGGILGSIGRYLTGYIFVKIINLNVIYGTLVANLIGCFVIGILVTCETKFQLFETPIRYLGIIGFCGSFTTFSSFALENTVLLDKGEYSLFISYALFSFILGMVCVLLGTKTISI